MIISFWGTEYVYLLAIKTSKTYLINNMVNMFKEAIYFIKCIQALGTRIDTRVIGRLPFSEEDVLKCLAVLLNECDNRELIGTE